MVDLKNWKHIATIPYVDKKTRHAMQVDIVRDSKIKKYLIFAEYKLIGRRKTDKDARMLAYNFVRVREG